jgi:hypothetical protein
MALSRFENAFNGRNNEHHEHNERNAIKNKIFRDSITQYIQIKWSVTCKAPVVPKELHPSPTTSAIWVAPRRVASSPCRDATPI